MGDLQERDEHTESGIFKSIIPDPGPKPPSSGSGAFDGSLSAIVESISLLHLQISADLESTVRNASTRTTTTSTPNSP